MTPEQSAQPDAWVEKAVDMFFKMGNLSMDLGGHEGDAASYEALSKEAKALAGEFLSHLLSRPPADHSEVMREAIEALDAVLSGDPWLNKAVDAIAKLEAAIGEVK